MSNSNIPQSAIAPSTEGVDYSILNGVEQGSPAHLRAIERIHAQEAAAAAKDNATLKGSGVGGHASAFAEIRSADALPSRESVTPGAMTKGVSSGNIDQVTISGVTMTYAAAEATRLACSPQEWERISGLKWVPIERGARLLAAQAGGEAAANDGNPDQEALDALLQKDDAAEEAARKAQQDEETALVHYEPSVLEHLLAPHLGPDKMDTIRGDVVKTGEISEEVVQNLGLSGQMISDTVNHYTSVANNMLEAEQSCVAYIENLMTDAEQAAFRGYLVAKDMENVRRLGVAARNRAASMSYEQVKNFLTPAEAEKLDLGRSGNKITVRIGNHQTTWSSAVGQGLLSFR